MSSTLFLLPRVVDNVAASSPTSYITHNRVTLMNNMSSILAGIALLFCMVVLGFTFVIWLDKDARKYLDRVSFRLIIYTMMANCIYSIGYIICVQVGPGFWCVAGVWLIQFWLSITNWLITCIALNLQLVLVHLCNGIKLEKWYLMGTLFISLATTLPPLIKGKFGWDPVIKVCWLTSDNDDDRLRWQISTQLAWILLTVFITLLCSIVTVGHLYKHKFISTRVLNSHRNSKHGFMADTNADKLVDRDDEYTVSKNLMGSHEFRKIILRISIYPIVMIILNLIITVADIRISTASGIYTSLDYGIYVIYYALYGARGIFYAAIACIDPALMRAYRVWRGERLSSGLSRIATYDNNYYDMAHVDVKTFDEEEAAATIHLHQHQHHGGIQIETEINTQIENLDHHLEMPTRLSPENPSPLAEGVGTTTTIHGANVLPTKPNTVYKRDSHPDLGGTSKKTTHWVDLDEPESSGFNEKDSDSGSIYSIGDAGPSDPAYIASIRRKQSARKQKRKEAEMEVTRQI